MPGPTQKGGGWPKPLRIKARQVALVSGQDRAAVSKQPGRRDDPGTDHRHLWPERLWTEWVNRNVVITTEDKMQDAWATAEGANLQNGRDQAVFNRCQMKHLKLMHGFA